jgi:hypothetical protein
MTMTEDRKKKKRFKLRNLFIDRVDHVDRGANQHATIELFKRAPEGEIRKHSGPDSHPVGSGQDVHGNRAGAKGARPKAQSVESGGSKVSRAGIKGKGGGGKSSGGSKKKTTSTSKPTPKPKPKPKPKAKTTPKPKPKPKTTTTSDEEKALLSDEIERIPGETEEAYEEGDRDVGLDRAVSLQQSMDQAEKLLAGLEEHRTLGGFKNSLTPQMAKDMFSDFEDIDASLGHIVGGDMTDESVSQEQFQELYRIRDEITDTMGDLEAIIHTEPPTDTPEGVNSRNRPPLTMIPTTGHSTGEVLLRMFTLVLPSRRYRSTTTRVRVAEDLSSTAPIPMRGGSRREWS